MPSYQLTPRTRAAGELWDARLLLERQVAEAEAAASDLAWQSTQQCAGCVAAAFEAARHDEEVAGLLKRQSELEARVQELVLVNAQLLSRVLRTLELEVQGSEADLALVREARECRRQAASLRVAPTPLQVPLPRLEVDVSPRLERVVAALERRTAALPQS